MMPERVDLLVIGGGMAGSMAAARAAQHGLSVALVRKGYGATALASGAVDFPADMPLPQDSIAAASLFFLSEMTAVGYPYAGSPDTPVTLLTAWGSRKRTHLYPESAAPGIFQAGISTQRVQRTQRETNMLTSVPSVSSVVDYSAEERLCFIGIRGLAEYNALAAARTVQQEGMARGDKIEASVVELAFPGVRHTHNLSSMVLAQLLDEPEIAAQFAETVRHATAQGSYTRLALPSLIGLERPVQAMAALQAACGLPCFELLSATPSVMGLRLQNSLDRIVLRAGVRLIPGTAGEAESERGRIVQITVRNRDDVRVFQPEAILLASGKFIGGGVRHEERWQETVLDLPLWRGQQPLQAESVRDLTQEAFAAPQPFLAVGVRVDDRLQPLEREGHVAYRNVWAAGAVLRGHQEDTRCSQLGAALTTGFAAGSWISERGSNRP